MDSQDDGVPRDLPVLVLMLKRAIPGHGKQRLAKGIGQDRTLLIADALLACALEDAVAWDGDLVFAVSANDEFEWAGDLAKFKLFESRTIQILVQCGGNLGARLRDLDERLRTTEDRKILLMAADAPGLKARHFSQSVEALAEFDITLVKSADGGTDLMGSRSGWPGMTDLPWGSGDLCDKLAARCADDGLAMQQFPGSFDIDTRADLVTAAQLLASDQRPARRNLVRQINSLAMN